MDDVPLSNPVQRGYDTSEAPLDSTKVQTSASRAREGGAARPLTQRNTLPAIMNIVNHVLICAITVYIIYLSFRKYSLFSWHPFLMTFGAFLLMAEAVMAMSGNNLLTRNLGRHARVRTHWSLQALAALSIFIGFLIIVINKNIHNKMHFQTWHSVFGLITVILVGMTSTGGVGALYSIKIQHVVKPALIKLIHNVVGIVTFICGIICIVLALYSGWFINNVSGASQVCCVIFVVLSAAITLEGAARSAYGRILNMSRGN